MRRQGQVPFASLRTAVAGGIGGRSEGADSRGCRGAKTRAPAGHANQLFGGIGAASDGLEGCLADKGGAAHEGGVFNGHVEGTIVTMPAEFLGWSELYKLRAWSIKPVVVWCPQCGFLGARPAIGLGHGLCGRNAPHGASMTLRTKRWEMLTIWLAPTPCRPKQAYRRCPFSFAHEARPFN